MSDVIEDIDGQTDEATPATEKPQGDQPIESVRKLVQRIISTIKADKRHHEKAFKRMKRDMFVAFHGREETWSEKNYKANIAGRHVKQKTASLYAKNPKVVARRAEHLDFAVWDETEQSLMLALQTIQAGAMAMQAHAAAGAAAVPPAAQSALPAPGGAAPPSGLSIPGQPIGDSMSTRPQTAMMGHNGGPAMEADFQLPPGFDEARAVVADFQQGMTRRKMADKVCRTLEVLFSKAMREQKPVDFKTGMKQTVRRATTTGVGYVKLGFQRDYGQPPNVTDGLADFRERIAHLQRLAEEQQEGEIENDDAEMAELQAAIAGLESEPEVVIREGLVFDYPRSTKVIPDRKTKTLMGFIGAGHIAVEYDFTPERVKELFNVDLKKSYNSYTPDGKAFNEVAGDFFDEDGEQVNNTKDGGMCRVWEYYDKDAGLVYYVADGYSGYLRDPAPPDVFVEDFWPVYAITFNEVENDDELFPLSDVSLMLDMQREQNRSRQGKREHRDAARPRWGYAKGSIVDADVEKISSVKPFEAIALNIDPQTELKKVLQSFPVPGVDPNLYDTGEVFNDLQMVVGSQEAQLGGLAKATATESAISANSSATSDSASTDELDGFITVIARAGGQILLREMSEDQVMQTVGPGASWPHETLEEIADEVFMEIEAGSTGKPNQAVEMRNWQMMLPFLIQMGSIKPEWLARETLRRLDDKMDLTDAVVAGIPAIIAQARGATGAAPMAQNPANEPGAQGNRGGDKIPTPAHEAAGSKPAFGSNQM